MVTPGPDARGDNSEPGSLRTTRTAPLSPRSGARNARSESASAEGIERRTVSAITLDGRFAWLPFTFRPSSGPDSTGVQDRHPDGPRGRARVLLPFPEERFHDLERGKAPTERQ